jgi:hypothetical protein
MGNARHRITLVLQPTRDEGADMIVTHRGSEEAPDRPRASPPLAGPISIPPPPR